MINQILSNTYSFFSSLFSPMTTIFLICIFNLIFAFYLKKSIFSIQIQKNEIHNITKLILDSIRQFAFKSFSSIFQVVIYITLTLLITTKIFSNLITANQLLAFFLGASIVLLILYLLIELTPKILTRVIQESKNIITHPLNIQFNTAFMIGISIFSFLIIGLIICYFYLKKSSIIGFAFGVIISSFFLRIGGGLYKSGTDIGNNLFFNNKNKNKKNPGTFLDLTGDFIGKLIGFNSDILGSFLLSFISCLFFSEALLDSNLINLDLNKKLTQLPFLILIASFIGNLIAFFWSKKRIKSQKFDNFLLEGLYINLIISGLSTFVIIYVLNMSIDFKSIWIGNNTFQPFFAYITGLIGAILIAFTSEVLTSHNYPTSKHIASLSEYGNTITSIGSLSLGFRSNGLYLMYLCLITILSYYFAGFYGIAMASIGMLSSTITIVTINSFNSLASSSYQIAKLSCKNETIKKNTSKMYDIGQTSIAIGSGFSTGAAILSSTGLFFSITLKSQTNLLDLFTINPYWLIGLVIGSVIPLIICGFLLKSLREISIEVIKEIKRQFQEIPFLKEEKSNPDMIKASQKISNKSLHYLILPGILLTIPPLLLGIIFGIKALVSFGLGTIIIGLSLGFCWGNIGEVAKNAKYYMKKGHFGGEESKSFQNIETTDRIGDVYKDLLSPSINIIMKSIIILIALVMLTIK